MKMHLLVMGFTGIYCHHCKYYSYSKITVNMYIVYGNSISFHQTPQLQDTQVPYPRSALLKMALI